jgi:lipopolysaccharide export system permease protein
LKLILFRYFAKEVFFTMAAVGGIVLVISMGWRFTGYLEQAAAGRLTPEVVFALMAFRLPGFLELIVPLSFFLAIMLAYGRMYVDSEMIVLQACGLSPARIVWTTLLLSIFVMIFTAAISLWLKPMGERKVEALLMEQKTLTEFDTLVPGRFQSLNSGKRVTYTEEIAAPGSLSRVFISEFQENKVDGHPGEIVTVISDSGTTQVDSSGRRFLVLNNGTRYRGTPGRADYRVVEYQEFGQLVEKGTVRPRDRRRTAIRTRDLFGAEDAEAISELHWRLSVVLMIPIITFMAVPLSKVNPRQGRFTRLVPAMILCFVYVVSLSGARSGLEEGNIPIELGLWWVHGIFIVITLLVYQLDRIDEMIDRLLSVRH